MLGAPVTRGDVVAAARVNCGSGASVRANSGDRAFVVRAGVPNSATGRDRRFGAAVRTGGGGVVATGAAAAGLRPAAGCWVITFAGLLCARVLGGLRSTVA